MSTLFDFGAAFLTNGFLYMTAGPFVLDEILRRFCPRTRDRIGKRFPAKTRRRIEVAIIILGVFYAGFAGFKEESDAKDAIQQQLTNLKTATPAPIPIEFLDKAAREKIENLEKDLRTANETIQRLQAESDPLAKPIASAQVVIAIKFSKSIGNSAASNLGGSLISVALLQQRTLSLGSSESVEPLLILDASHYQVTDSELHAQGSMRFDSRLVGKTIRSLKSSTVLQLELPAEFGGEAAGGIITIVLNGSISLAFKIPPQTASQPIGNGIAYRIFDVKETLRALDSKQP